MVIGAYISIITLNVNGLNAPTKRHRQAECIQTRPIHMLSTRDPFQTESEGIEKGIPCKWKLNTMGLEINYRKKNCKKHKHVETK